MGAVAPDLDVAAVVGADVLDDRQAETGAAGGPGAGGVHPVEALEDAGLLVLGDARPLVGDGDLDRVALQARAHADRGVGVGVGDRVADEVAHGGDEHVLVAAHVQVLGDLVGQGDVLGLGLDAQVLEGERDDVLDLDELRVLQDRRALEPGELDDLLDQARQAHRLTLHPTGEAVDGLGVVLGVHDRLGEQGDATDRRLELVADVGDEVASGLLDAAALGLVVDEQQHVLGAERSDARGHVRDIAQPRPGQLELGLADHAVAGDLGDHRGDLVVDEAAVAHDAVGDRGGRALDDASGVVEHDTRRAEHGQDVPDTTGHLRLGLPLHGAFAVAQGDRRPDQEADEHAGDATENCRGRWLHVTESTSPTGHAGSGLPTTRWAPVLFTCALRGVHWNHVHWAGDLS
ncbi:hypothetical protein JAAN108728_13830 [Janibacter anophelis]